MMEVQSMEAVSRPLSDGIVSICNICKSLRNAHVNPITDMCSNYKTIREHIEQAERCLKTSHTLIKEKLGCLDKRMEQLIREKQSVEQQKNEKKQVMNELHIKKDSAEKSLKYSKKTLEQAENNVQLANYDLRVHQDRMNEYDDMETAGAILIAIPVFGWIAGPIMMHEAQKGIKEALNAMRAAEWEKQSSESQVMNCTKKVYHYQNIISRITNEIQQTNEALRRIELETERVQKDLKGTSNIQQMVRKAMNLLSVLSGRVTVLQSQTQRFILWEPVVNIMKDVMKAVVNIAENRLLYSKGVPVFINTLRENVGELLALCSSASNSECDNYY